MELSHGGAHTIEFGRRSFVIGAYVMQLTGYMLRNGTCMMELARCLHDGARAMEPASCSLELAFCSLPPGASAVELTLWSSCWSLRDGIHVV